MNYLVEIVQFAKVILIFRSRNKLSRREKRLILNFIKRSGECQIKNFSVQMCPDHLQLLE